MRTRHYYFYTKKIIPPETKKSYLILHIYKVIIRKDAKNPKPHALRCHVPELKFEKKNDFFKKITLKTP